MAEIPQDVEAKLKRGRERKEEGSSERKVSLEFWRGNQFKFANSKGAIQGLSTTTDFEGRSGKPAHRARTSRNKIFGVVEHEVSMATQRVPAYEVSPSTSDPEDKDAARLAAKVLRYGYDKWRVRAVTAAVVRYAIINDGGFAWPYFDNSVGRPIGDGIAEGEIKIKVFGPDEVGWEPDLDFFESRWHFIEQAQDLDQIKQMEGYVGGDLKADAEGPGNLAMVTEFLERPSRKQATGRWLTLCNGKVIVESRDYPCTDPGGEPIDEPVLHKLCYASDPEGDRDQGLVPHLIDSQRTINDCVNKALEWKNLALNPQVIIWNGGFAKGQRLNDVPGTAYQAFGSGKVEWRPVPPIPQELFALKDQAEADIAQIAAQNDIPSQVESARGIQALLERDANRRNNFLNELAEFHSRLARHNLYLVQKHYTEDRQLKIRGRFGPELQKNFQGAQLRGQADVTVMTGSIEPRTKAAIESKIMLFAQNGWVSPQAAMAAINGGTAEDLVQGYEDDIGRANEIIQTIRDGPEALFNQPPRRPLPSEDAGIDPETGAPNEFLPGWMPRPFDDVKVQRSVFESWMKTTDYSSLDPGTQEAANVYYDALLQIEARKDAEAAMAQTQMAESLGTQNAAKPQDQPTPLPSQASLNGQGDDQA